MDFSSMLRSSFLCSCGQVHRCDTRAVLIARGALEKVPEYLAAHKRLLVVSDLNTRAACGERLLGLLLGQGFEAREACFEQTTPVEPDEKAIAFLESRMEPDIQAVVGVGGGVINDLTKYLAHHHGLPNLYVCTAPSMDGIATNTSVLTQKGLKFTVPQQVPRWIVADLDVLTNAPLRCIRAGLGDVLGKYSALSDWRLARLLTGEPLCEAVYQSVETALKICVKNLDGCMRREEEAIGHLADSLALIGIAAGYVQVSRPGSGAEHMLGHSFEIAGQVRGTPFLSHGENVGYSALVVERLRKRLLGENPTRFCYDFDRGAWEVGLRRLFPPLADDIIAMQDKAGTHRNHCAKMVESWPQIRVFLEQTPGEEALQDLLRRADFTREEFLGVYGETAIRDNILYCNDLKVKHTLFQLLTDVGLLTRYARETEL